MSAEHASELELAAAKYTRVMNNERVRNLSDHLDSTSMDDLRDYLSSTRTSDLQNMREKYPQVLLKILDIAKSDLSYRYEDAKQFGMSASQKKGYLAMNASRGEAIKMNEEIYQLIGKDESGNASMLMVDNELSELRAAVLWQAKSTGVDTSQLFNEIISNVIGLMYYVRDLPIPEYISAKPERWDILIKYMDAVAGLVRSSVHKLSVADEVKKGTTLKIAERRADIADQEMIQVDNKRLYETTSELRSEMAKFSQNAEKCVAAIQGDLPKGVKQTEESK